MHHLPLRMSKRYIEVGPDDVGISLVRSSLLTRVQVIFPNLGIDPFQGKIRYLISWAATIGLIIGWAFPVTFVGLLSNVNQLCAQVPWLNWLCQLPVPINVSLQQAIVIWADIVIGYYSRVSFDRNQACDADYANSVLPPLALALLFLVLPIILRCM